MSLIKQTKCCKVVSPTNGLRLQLPQAHHVGHHSAFIDLHEEACISQLSKPEYSPRSWAVPYSLSLIAASVRLAFEVKCAWP